MVVAGAPPPTRMIEQMETELGWEFIQIYGLTETAPLLTMSRRRAEWDALTPAARARRSSAARARPRWACGCDISDQGEVLARSNVVLEGYWEQPEATADALAGGWFHTGDGGTIDDDNYLTISDRKKDVIISGGENVSSIEVEDCLYQHPDGRGGVRDRRARREVGRDGEGAGRAEARTRRDRGRPDRALPRRRSRTSSARRRSSSASEFARTSTGKLQKFKIRAPYWEGRTRRIN